jgi:hypothetical protein
LKKVFLTILILLFITSASYAISYVQYSPPRGWTKYVYKPDTGLLTLLDAVSTTGVPADSYWYDMIYLQDRCAVTVTITGSPSAVTVAVEGAIDGSSFTEKARHTFDSTELSQGYANFVIVDQPMVQIRGNLITLDGGTNPTVTMKVRCGGN